MMSKWQPHDQLGIINIPNKQQFNASTGRVNDDANAAYGESNSTQRDTVMNPYQMTHTTGIFNYKNASRLNQLDSSINKKHKSYDRSEAQRSYLSKIQNSNKTNTRK